MPWSTTNGVRTYYEVAGEGPPMVMVHANPLDHRMWLYQVAHFSRWFRTIAVDLRGYGRSDKPVRPYPFAEVVADIRGVCRAEADGAAVFMAASLGAKIALAMAMDEPACCAGLALVGGNAFRGRSYDSRIAGYRADGMGYRSRHVAELVAPEFARSPQGQAMTELLLQDTEALSGEAIARLFESFDGVDLSGGVSALRLPVLIVNGEHDISLPGARATAARIDGAAQRIMAGAGHLCCLEAPVEFNRIVDEFFQTTGLWPGRQTGSLSGPAAG